MLFLSKLILNRENVVEILRSQGLRILVDLVTLAHLHTSRAVVPTQTQVLACYFAAVLCNRNPDPTFQMVRILHGIFCYYFNQKFFFVSPCVGLHITTRYKLFRGIFFWKNLNFLHRAICWEIVKFYQFVSVVLFQIHFEYRAARILFRNDFSGSRSWSRSETSNTCKFRIRPLLKCSIQSASWVNSSFNSTPMPSPSSVLVVIPGFELCLDGL